MKSDFLIKRTIFSADLADSIPLNYHFYAKEIDGERKRVDR